MLATNIIGRDPSDRANRLAALLLCGVAWWAFCEVVWNAQSDPRVALWWVKASALGWVWVGPLALHLFLEITGEAAPRVRALLPRIYALGGGFLLLDWWTPWVHGEMVRESWGWAYELTSGYPFFYVFTVSCIFAALRLGRRAYQGSPSPAERAQARWVGGGILIPLSVASLTDGLLPMLGVQWPRLGTAAFAVLGGTIAWSFYRYGFSLLVPGAFGNEILETLPDGVAMLRSDGRVRRANGTLARLVGCAPSDLVGVRVDDLLIDLEADLADEVRELPCELRTVLGSSTAVSVSSTVLRDRQGSPIGLVLVARDVREVVSLRNRLMLSGRLAAVGELAAGIAHEINNPLAYVRTNLGMLRRHWDALGGEIAKAEGGERAQELLAEGEDMLDESLQGVDRATAIVRDVRGLAHAGGGERQRADLNVLLDGVIRMAAPQLPTPGCVEKRYAELPQLACAPQELQQVFLNLVLNAGHAIGESGSIEVGTQTDGDSVIVTVSDDGCGISEEVAGRIFDPFFTTKAVGEGTGLGLPIAYEIVRKHGGEIAVESEPGRGTCFRVRLPVRVDTLDA